MAEHAARTPRLRMFAGPNGSGKSTLKVMLSNDLLGVYINPDDIQKQLGQFGFLDLHHYAISTTQEEVLSFFTSSTLLAKADLLGGVSRLKLTGSKLGFTADTTNAYFASVCADFIRRKLMQKQVSFTFETVMSAPDKIELLKTAQRLGYRTYLYYIATDNPRINISRVRQRVESGGHDVPQDKIVSRYHRSLQQLPAAIKVSNRAYIFDNSGTASVWLCEITDGNQIEYKQNLVPDWIHRYVVESMAG
jgi:predicted ABC-type ATPase